MASDPTPEGALTPREFRTHVEPVAAALRKVVRAARTERPDSFLPDASSPAMREMADQLMFHGSDEGVIDVSQALTSQRLKAGEDHVLAVCDLWLVDNETYVWSVPVLGRAALEAFALVFHLCDPNVARTVRAGRTMNELIYRAQAVDQLPRDMKRPSNRVDFRIDQADSMGLQRQMTTKGKLTPWFEEVRPSYRAAVKALFGDEDLGDALYNFWSAVAHGSSWGLSETLGEVEHDASAAAFRAPIVLSIETVMTTAAVLALGHRRVVERLAQWSGWSTETHGTRYDELASMYADHLSQRQVGPEAAPQASTAFSGATLWTPPTP